MSIADELTKLEELRRTGALSDEEFAHAKKLILEGKPVTEEPALAKHIASQLGEVRYQNELARVDREWENERQQYMIADRYGRRTVPSTGMGIMVAVVGGSFGLLWTILSASMMSGGPSDGSFGAVRVIFPLFGVLFIVAAIVMGAYSHSRAVKYQQAYAAYVARREKIRPEEIR